MWRCFNGDKGERFAELKFFRDELLYDAKNYSYVEGDIMETDNEHARHQTQDIGEGGNVDRVTRVLNLAHAECVELLYPYTKIEVPKERGTATDVLTEPSEYVINMELPAGFSDTTVKLLENLIHEFLVCRVMEDWMSIVNTKKRDVWRSKLEETRREIRMALLSRRGVLRRKSSPF